MFNSIPNYRFGNQEREIMSKSKVLPVDKKGNTYMFKDIFRILKMYKSQNMYMKHEGKKCFWITVENSNNGTKTALLVKSIGFNQAEVLCGHFKGLKVSGIEKSMQDKKFEYFKKKILEVLDIQEKNEGTELKKAIETFELLQKSYNIGTIRTWQGNKYIKGPDKKWRRYYEKENRGAKMAIAALKKKINEAKDSEDLLKIVMANSNRFRDKDGNQLPIVQELSKYVSSRNNKQNSTTDSGDTDSAKKVFNDLSSVLEAGKTMSVEHKNLGEILIEKGNEKYGLYHIVKRRAEEKKTDEEISAILYLIQDALKDGTETKLPTSDERYKIEKNGIAAFIKKMPDGRKLLSGFDSNDKKQEATDAIQTVIAQHGYTPEFSDIRKQVGAVTASLNTLSTQKDDLSSGMSAIREKYQSSKTLTGDEDEIQVGKELISGTWKLVEADSTTASHDETTFTKTDGFPLSEDGSTINDRDYSTDKDAQETVLEIASEFDGRALSVDNPVVVTADGVVISGNNRTMSSKIAALKGTDTAYTVALQKRAKKFGFTSSDIAGFKNPRVVFEVASNDGYSTEQFAKFNQSSKKSQNPIEKAVKISKTMKTETIKSIATKISDFSTMGELYADKKACEDIYNSLQTANVIQQVDRSQYITPDGGITGAGKEFLETVLIGSVVSEKRVSTETIEKIYQIT